WTQKYAPGSLKEVAGNEDAKEEIRKWALEAERGKKVQPLLIHGPVGAGKTALANALAAEMGWEILETNASDLRDAEMLKKIYGIAASSTGLFGNRRLILIDEIDSVSDRQEFGALLTIIKDCTQPLILIANDVWNQKLSTLRYQCKQVEMRKVNSASIRKRLFEIANAENLQAPSGNDSTPRHAEREPIENTDSKAEVISKNASGDMRGALNDLQGTQQLSDFDPVKFGRDRDENIFEAVRTVFKTMDYKDAIAAGNSYNTQEFDMFMKWLEENIPLEYEKQEDVAQAFGWLSRADIFRGRIMNRQHWGFLKYVNALSTAGIALSKAQTYRKFTKYQFPGSIRKMGQTKKNRAMLKSAKRKIARKLHVSIDDAANAFSALSACPGFFDYMEFSEDERLAAAELYKHDNKKKGKS
ncbi:MAG: AAA family ATPase, partial [Candidatus Micrarchaeota archaeon]